MLIVGLGNPGEEYDNTYHNLGFLAIDRLAAAHGIRVTRAEGKAITGVGRIAGADVVLAKPQTYMNLSGGSVKELLAKYTLPVDQLLLIYDELALDWGSMRIRPKGSAGGHNGVSSIIRSVGTEEIARIRLGIRPERPVKEMKSYVLAKIRRAQLETLDPLLDEVVTAAESIITEGVEKAMARFNARRAPGAKEET